MKKVYRTLFLWVIALGTGVWVLLLATMPSHRINKASFDQIKNGMSKKDIELLIRVPPGLYCDRSVSINLGQLGHPPQDTYASVEAFELLQSFEDEENGCFWIGVGGAIRATFDEKDVIQSWKFFEVEPVSLRDRIQSWILRLFWPSQSSPNLDVGADAENNVDCFEDATGSPI